MKKVIIATILLLAAFFLFFTVPSFFSPHLGTSDSTQSYHKVILDPSLFYRSGHEYTAVTPYDFFRSRALDEIPADIGEWHLENLTFRDSTYDFYSPDEISGKQVSKDGEKFFIILVYGPKLFWHTPENCYLFSNWTVTDMTVGILHPDPFDEMLYGDAIYTNKLSVAKDSARYLVKYFYIFRDRSDIRNVSQLTVIVPLNGNTTATDSSAALFVKKLFPPETGTDMDYGSSSIPNDSRIFYGENNPPEIRDWLVIGPWITESPGNMSFPAADWETDWLKKDYSNRYPSVGLSANGRTWEVTNGSYGIVRFDYPLARNTTMYAYAGEYIYSDRTKTVFLHAVSDDGIRIWLNGNLIHSRIRSGMGDQTMNTVLMRRGSSPEDTVPITLHSGWNFLLLELYQWKGSFEYYCTIRNLDGSHDPGLQYSVTRPVDISNDTIKIFQIGYPDNSAAEFSSEWDVQSNYTVGEGFREFPRAVSNIHRITRIHFLLPKEETGLPHTLSLGAKKIDTSEIGFIVVNVSMNGKYAGSYRYPEDWLSKRLEIGSDSFRYGPNTVELEWVNGENYVVWDYLDLT
jgi:hypothetical protein